MQPLKYLSNWLHANANEEHYLFRFSDLRCLFSNLSEQAFKTLISRVATNGLLTRVCRGIYVYQQAAKADGYILYDIAVLLRANNFNYISLETILSNYGIISQMPINRLTIMTSGRSNIIDCREYGAIEFIHTEHKPQQILDLLHYNTHTRLWEANVKLALLDMKRTRRNCNLINWELANELI